MHQKYQKKILGEYNLLELYRLVEKLKEIHNDLEIYIQDIIYETKIKKEMRELFILVNLEI